MEVETEVQMATLIVTDTILFNLVVDGVVIMASQAEVTMVLFMIHTDHAQTALHLQSLKDDVESMMYSKTCQIQTDNDSYE